jgi:hypothetical protein
VVKIGVKLQETKKNRAMRSTIAGGVIWSIFTFDYFKKRSIAITNGTLTNVDTSTDGLDLRIYVNSSPTPVFSGITSPGQNSSLSFAPSLGNLNAGDTIYVAIGPRDIDSFDAFALEYGIEFTDRVIPEPTTLVGSMLLALGWLGFKKKNN